MTVVRFALVAICLAVGGCDYQSDRASSVSATETEVAKWQRLATAGDSKDQYQLGVAYAEGLGVTQDFAMAATWYEKAAAQGNKDAQFALARLLQDGKGIPEDDAKAAEWMQKAASQGHATAQGQLGLMYFQGAGVPKDPSKGVELIGLSAASGDAFGQTLLGALYKTGLHGLQRDPAKAVSFFRQAADQGYPDAFWSLADMYREGKGVPKDSAKAMELYEKALAGGESVTALMGISVLLAGDEAKPKDLDAVIKGFAAHPYLFGHTLATMYILGRGVPRDAVLAYAWANIGAAGGDPFAAETRDSIELTPSQLAEAQRLSSGWTEGQLLRREKEAPQAGNVKKAGSGTAFVLTQDGKAITNSHAVANCKDLRVQSSGDSVRVLVRDETSDIALLQLSGKFNATAALSKTVDGLRQGQEVVVFGYPLDSILSSGGNLTPGVVSALTGLGNNSTQIQITAPIQPGSSGSPVMDRYGNVVGMVSMKLSDKAMATQIGTLPQNVNFAVSGRALRAFLDANRVSYRSGGTMFSRQKSLADIGDQARKWTTLIECWQ